MKLFSYALMISLALNLLTSCANSGNGNHHVPDLQSFQGNTMPTASANAATFAATGKST